MDAPGTKLRDVLAAAAVFSVLAVALTYPFALHLADHLADTGDSFEYAWVLGFGAYQLTHHPFQLYDGNILYPFPLSLAYSDSNLPNVVLGAPIVLLTGNSALALNLLILLTFALAGLGMFLLVLNRTGSRYAAYAAGLSYGFSPFLFDHVAQIPNLSIEWAPFALWSFDRYLATGRTRWAVGFALASLLQVLVSFYYAFILGIGIGIYVITRLAQERAVLRRPAWIARLLGCAAIASLVAVPLVLPYFEVEHQFGLQRTLGEAERYSAWPANFLAATSTLRVQIVAPLVRFLAARDPTLQVAAPERQLYPGTLTLVFAVVALFRVRWTRWIAPFLMVMLGVALAFGPTFHPRNDVQLALPIPMPYTLLFDFVPGFTALRVPSRFGALVVLGLALLTGEGLSNVLDRLKTWAAQRHWQRRLPALVGCACLAILAVESADRMPGEPIRSGAYVPAVYQWLAAQPIPSPTVEIPIDVDAFRESPRSYYSTYHHQPLVNGSRSFLPPGYDALVETLSTFPSRSATSAMAQLGVRYIVVHRAELPRLTVDLLSTNPNREIHRVAQFGSDDVYEIAGHDQKSSFQLVAVPPCPTPSGNLGTMPITLEPIDDAIVAILPEGVTDLGFALDWHGTAGKSYRETVYAPVPARVLTLPTTLLVAYHRPTEPDLDSLTVATLDKSGRPDASSATTVRLATSQKNLSDAVPTLALATLTSSRGWLDAGIPYEFRWQFDTAPSEPLVPFANAYDDHGRYWSASLDEDQLFQHPPPCAGVQTVDSHRLRLFPDAPVGLYQVEVGILNEATGKRVPFVGPNGNTITKLDVGKYRVLPGSVIPGGSADDLTAGQQVFGNAIVLDHGDIGSTGKPGMDLPVDLQWSSLSSVTIHYTQFIHITDASGRLIAQSDHLLGGTAYPTSAWQPGDVVDDHESISMPSDLPPGPLEVRVGLYDLSTMQRLPVTTDSAHTGADYVTIGTVNR